VIAQSYWNAYRDNDFLVIYLVSADDAGNDPSPEALAEHAGELGLTYPVLADQGWYVQSLFSRDDSMPSLTLFAPGPTVVTVDDITLGYEDIEELLGL
jgi:hypothetical protein